MKPLVNRRIAITAFLSGTLTVIATLTYLAGLPLEGAFLTFAAMCLASATRGWIKVNNLRQEEAFLLGKAEAYDHAATIVDQVEQVDPMHFSHWN